MTCYRCGAPAFITVAQGRISETEYVAVSVVLCHNCRNRASRENSAAFSRRTGKQI